MNNQNIEFEEKFDPALISALYKNFKDPIQAVLEITDNAIDDIIPYNQMIITIEIEKDTICIVNKGGKGMGSEELSAFFIWGKREGCSFGKRSESCGVCRQQMERFLKILTTYSKRRNSSRFIYRTGSKTVRA